VQLICGSDLDVDSTVLFRALVLSGSQSRSAPTERRRDVRSVSTVGTM
jgi:hypothetical protein